MNKSRISLDEQVRLMKFYYPDGTIEFIKNRGFIWFGELRSSPLGDLYKIKIVFEIRKKPEVFVVEPEKLKMANGKFKLPHVYDNTKQKLCLFYPDDKEWNTSKMIASTIVPWTIEWLYHYELWVILGKWMGGGKHPNSSLDK